MQHQRGPIIRLASSALLLLLPAAFAAAQERAPSEKPDSQKVRVLVAYYSLRGNTERLARGVAEGAAELPDVLVTTKPVQDVVQEDLQAADAIALGAATYFANIPGEMKVAIDDWNWKWKVDFTDKVGGAFSTGGGQTGGKEFVVVSLLMFMLNNRMLVAGPLYQDAEGDDKWGEAGASAITGPLDPGVGEPELDGARRLGRRLATLAKKLQGK